MNKSIQRRVLGVVTIVLASQMLSACIVLPVPAHRARAVVVQPGYGYPPPPPHYDNRGPYWRR